ncbi:hypothetical protein ABMA28_015748 [Loxostege sticticalis]|uniref:Serpin domain-containing protein n=1 Tax=Loxostege sticticalis TaxID=481309 RepID=A0ABD0TAY1_LOXSC
MLKSLLLLCVASGLLFADTFAGDTDDDERSSAYAYANSSSHSSSETRERCGKNERYVKCPTSLCVPFTCDQLGKPITCPRIIPGRCPDKPACVCNEGYVRNKKGVCIPKGKCPSCGGDPNARAGCGHLCSERCGSTKPVPKDCPCELNGCVCKPGYIYDAQQRKCVKKGHCSVLCPKPNEIYDSCILACPLRQCGIDDRAVLCAADQPCQPPGCRCKDGTYRNTDDICVTWEECPKEPETGPYTCDDSVEQLLEDGNYNWTAHFMHEAITKYPNKSNIMSAFSCFVPIGEMALYAEGNTLDELLKTLNLRSKEDIRCVFPRIISRLRAELNVILNIANRIFTTDVYPLTDEFLDDTKNVFDAVAESLDFNQPQAAADRINTWVSNETNNRIKDIATPDMFSSDTRLVLANAIYFLGNWVSQFDPDKTEDRPFYVSKEKTVQIPTMYQQRSFKYGEHPDLKCKTLEMPYKGGNFSFLIYLPDDVEGLKTMLEQLKYPKAFFDSHGAMSYQKVQAYIPKIKCESEYDLSGIMRSGGMRDVFDSSKSNLTGILKQYERLFVSAAKQKAFGLVNEIGTEAAAANIIVVGTTSAVSPPPRTYIFDAKQPFAFYIMYGRIPIFSGTFYGDSIP